MRKTIQTALSLLTLLSVAYAQNPPTGIQDEGGTISYPAYVLDCVGAGISCSHSGNTGTITVSGGGSATVTTQEEDVTVDASTDTLDFQTCFDLTSTPSGEANVSFDSSECTVNADALKANGANCSAGQYPLGVDASGAVESCTADQDTQLTEEQVEDFVGDMLGGTETRITVTYDDAGNAINFVVDDMNDDVPESGDFGAASDLEATGELSADVVDQSKIADNAIQEEHLKAVDAASDEECLTYETTTGDFEWQACGGSEVNDLSSVVTWANVPNANITQSSVTQHQAALSITESQISDLSHTTDTNANTLCAGTNVYLDGEGNCDTVVDTDTNANTACAGTTTYLDGEGNCDDISTVYEPTIGADSLTHADIADADQADTKCLWFEDPTAADDFKSIWANKTANDFQLTEIWAESDQTVTFMLQVDDGTPSDVDTVDLAPAAGEAEDTSLNGDTVVAAGEELDLAITSVSGTPTWVSICFTGNWAD